MKRVPDLLRFISRSTRLGTFEWRMLLQTLLRGRWSRNSDATLGALFKENEVVRPGKMRWETWRHKSITSGSLKHNDIILKQ